MAESSRYKIQHNLSTARLYWEKHNLRRDTSESGKDLNEFECGTFDEQTFYRPQIWVKLMFYEEVLVNVSLQ